MITATTIDGILGRLPDLRIGVLGDLFLDRYLDIDGRLTEPSIETSLDAYQVVRVRSYPGAAGTVINNLVAMGVGRVVPIAVIGDDGEGYELSQALSRMPMVDTANVFRDSTRRTPTYTKPMLSEPGTPEHGTASRELNRLDIKNRTLLAEPFETRERSSLVDIWASLDALLVLDHEQAVCGVVTDKVRQRLQSLGQADPKKWVLVDSREPHRPISRGVAQAKSNGMHAGNGRKSVEAGVVVWAQQAGRPLVLAHLEKMAF